MRLREVKRAVFEKHLFERGEIEGELEDTAMKLKQASAFGGGDETARAADQKGVLGNMRVHVQRRPGGTEHGAGLRCQRRKVDRHDLVIEGQPADRSQPGSSFAAVVRQVYADRR